MALEGVSSSVFESLFTEVRETAINNKPLFKSHPRLEPLLINLSGGQKASNSELNSAGTAWLDLIRNKCKENVLMITAVGNDGIELTKDNLDNGILPSILKIPRSCADKDIILRVGATNYYKIEEDIGKYFRSNYGNGYVDILAPGANIPIITPKNYASIAGGTSEATAIVTAAAALLSSCNPFATAASIKKAILDNADHYPQLEQYVVGGKVLNIAKAVESFCKIKLPSKKTVIKKAEMEFNYLGEFIRFIWG